MKREVFCALALTCFIACSGNVPRTRKALDETRLELARSLSVAQRAPELWANVERARKQASLLASEDPAQAELISEARLWLEAAIAECERADLAEKRLAMEREIEELDRVALRATRALEHATKELQLHEAAMIAKEEATRALERAATLPVRRPKLDKANVSAAAAALITRGRLVVTAAKALGATGKESDALMARLDEAERVRLKSPDAALDLADHALFDAVALLGQQRRQRGDAPRPGEAKELASLLDQAGFRVQRGDTGLIAHLPEPFTRTSLSHAAARKLSRVCALSELHTLGAVRVQVVGSTRVRAERVREVSEALAQSGCVGERFGVDVSDGADALDVAWLSY
jgi:hypothetical protein